MAEDKEIRIVIKAKDEFSTELEKASMAVDGTAANIKRSLDGAYAADGLKEYESALARVMALEQVSANRKKEAFLQFAALEDRSALSEADAESRDARMSQNKLEALYAYNAAVIQASKDTGAAKASVERTYYEQSIELAKRERDFKILYTAETAGAISNFWQNLYVATGKNNRKMFEIMKAFAIAETIIATYSAAQKAFDKGITETGSYWGGVAYAAAATVAGAARVAEIQRQKPADTGGSISSGGAANPSYQGGSPSAYPVPSRFEGDATPAAPQQITVIVNNPLSDGNWDAMSESIVDAINRAAERNVNVTVKAA
ncbi:MAG: hypothetical protein HY884_06925 [Deltaproteobacteria bacterium]|nr:hypothetical protein [Deltaproteobacteria bacterium]